jgi:hypothetical protein
MQLWFFDWCPIECPPADGEAIWQAGSLDKQKIRKLEVLAPAVAAVVAGIDYACRRDGIALLVVTIEDTSAAISALQDPRQNLELLGKPCADVVKRVASRHRHVFHGKNYSTTIAVPHQIDEATLAAMNGRDRANALGKLVGSNSTLSAIEAISFRGRATASPAWHELIRTQGKFMLKLQSDWMQNERYLSRYSRADKPWLTFGLFFAGTYVLSFTLLFLLQLSFGRDLPALIYSSLSGALWLSMFFVFLSATTGFLIRNLRNLKRLRDLRIQLSDGVACIAWCGVYEQCLRDSVGERAAARSYLASSLETAKAIVAKADARLQSETQMLIFIVTTASLVLALMAAVAAGVTSDTFKMLLGLQLPSS